MATVAMVTVVTNDGCWFEPSFDEVGKHILLHGEQLADKHVRLRDLENVSILEGHSVPGALWVTGGHMTRVEVFVLPHCHYLGA